MSRSITLKSPGEIQIMRDANRIVAETLAMLESRIEPGLSTLQLDRWAEEFAGKRDGVPAFKGYRGFPGSLCVSLNEEVVHGIPSELVILNEGDIISIDFGVKFKGFYGDAAITVPVGKVSPLKEKLINITRQALDMAVAQVQVGNRVNDISSSVERHVAASSSFSVVRQFVGHGIGSQLHEPPEIPNYSRKGQTPRLLPGMVLAIEPMVNAGKFEVKVLKDGWTVVTVDRKPSAHFEHTVVVTDDGPQVLTVRDA